MSCIGLADLPEIKNNVRTSEEWREKYKDDSLIINNNRSAEILKHDNVEQKLLEYFDRRYWEAIKAGDIEEANRIKAEWEQTEKIILNKIQLSLDATGIIDPTPISDGTNAIISVFRGNYIEAGLSTTAILPFAGDIVAKSTKYGLKYSDEIGGVAAKSLATSADEAVFWSGIRGGDTAAAKWVSQYSGSTLETTLANRGINLPAWDASNPATVAVWRQASKEFAAGASGNVRVLQTDAVRIKSVWAEVEFPALKANQNVTSIRGVNPENGVETLLWSR